MDFHHWQWILTIVGLSVTGMIFDHYFADHPYYPYIIKTITDYTADFEFIIFFIKGVVIWAAILSPFALYILIEELMIYYKKKK